MGKEAQDIVIKIMPVVLRIDIASVLIDRNANMGVSNDTIINL